MKTWKKLPSKVAHDQPKKIFQYCQPAQNQSKSHFLLHKNVSLCNFYTMTLLIANPKYRDTIIWEGYSYFHYIVHAFQFAEHYF